MPLCLAHVNTLLSELFSPIACPEPFAWSLWSPLSDSLPSSPNLNWIDPTTCTSSSELYSLTSPSTWIIPVAWEVWLYSRATSCLLWCRTSWTLPLRTLRARCVSVFVPLDEYAKTSHFPIITIKTLIAFHFICPLEIEILKTVEAVWRGSIVWSCCYPT